MALGLAFHMSHQCSNVQKNCDRPKNSFLLSFLHFSGSFVDSCFSDVRDDLNKESEMFAQKWTNSRLFVACIMLCNWNIVMGTINQKIRCCVFHTKCAVTFVDFITFTVQERSTRK